MNTKLDVTLTTNLQALVPLVFLTSKSWDEKYASYPYRKLRGPHPVDMSEHIPDIPTITGDVPQYSLVMKSPCGSGKTELIGSTLINANSFLNVSGRVTTRLQTYSRM